MYEKLELLEQMLLRSFQKIGLNASVILRTKPSNHILVISSMGQFSVTEDEIYTRGIIMTRKVPGFMVTCKEPNGEISEISCASAREVAIEIFGKITDRAIEAAADSIWVEEMEDRL